MLSDPSASVPQVAGQRLRRVCVVGNRSLPFDRGAHQLAAAFRPKWTDDRSEIRDSGLALGYVRRVSETSCTSLSALFVSLESEAAQAA
jgi:hypothetical protein